MENSARFLTTFDFDRDYLRNDSRYPKSKRNVSTAIPPAFNGNNPVNFRPQTKKYYWLELSHPSGFFGRDYISALKGCCPLKFSYALEFHQVLLVHTKMRMRAPPKKKIFDRENLKFGLNFSVLVPHFGASGGILTTGRRDELWSTNKNVIAHIDPPDVLVHCKLTQVHR